MELLPINISLLCDEIKSYGVTMFTNNALLVATPVVLVLYMFGSKPTQARIEKIYDNSANRILDDLEARVKGE